MLHSDFPLKISQFLNSFEQQETHEQRAVDYVRELAAWGPSRCPVGAPPTQWMAMEHDHIQQKMVFFCGPAKINHD